MTKGSDVSTPETQTGDMPDDSAQWAELANEINAEEGQANGDGGKETEAEGGEKAVDQGKDQDGGEDGGKEDGEQRPESVSYQEHENVKRALKEAREQSRATQEQLAGITELINNLRANKGQQGQQETEQAPQIPDINEDPIGHFQAKLAILEKANEELRTGSQKTQEQFQQTEQERQFANTVINSEHEMRRTTPDYDQACQHLESARIAELEAIFADDNPQAQAMARQANLRSVADLRAAMLNQDRIAVAQQAIHLGMSPAQLYYNLAKQRGYQPQKPNGNGQGNGQQQNGQTDAAKLAEQALNAARRGQKASSTLSGGSGGGGPDNPLSVADLTALYADDPEEFDRQWDKMARQGRLG